MSQKIALITGVTGQDGAHLTRLLLDKGYIVHDVKRRSSSFNTARVDELYVDPHEHPTRFFMHYGDLTDAKSGRALVKVDKRYFRPTEVEQLLGDASKARAALGWKPRTGFHELVAGMVEHDLRNIQGDIWRKDRLAG